MENTEFRELVKFMRKVQTDYFATGSKIILNKSKELEKRVDDELNGITPEPKEQLKLF